MKPTTVQLLLAVLGSDDTVISAHAARIKQALEDGGVVPMPVDGPLLTISEAARQLGYCRPWLYEVLHREALWEAKEKTFQTVPPPGGGEGCRLRQCDVDAYKRRTAAFKPRRRKQAVAA